MSIMPNFGFQRANTFDPFNPFKDFHFNAPLGHGHGQVPVHGHGHGQLPVHGHGHGHTQMPHNSNETFINVKIDWKETSEAHIFRADLPGVKKDEIRVQVEEDRVLKISGERHLEKDDREDREGSKYHCVERSGGKFFRVFRLPDNARIDHVKASMHDGVLTVVVPKEELRKPKTVHII